MIICPTCEHVNPEGASNCEECFTPLPIIIQCPQCGESVQNDAVFCGNCGYNLQKPVQEAEVPTSQPFKATEEPDGNVEVIEFQELPTVPPQQEEEITPIVPVSQIFLHHVQTDRKFEIQSSLTIIHLGRPNDEIPPDLDLSGLPNADVVSRIHADMRLEADGYYLEDMGSANGTYVNGQRLLQGNRHLLTPGDRFSLGKEDKVTFIFSVS